MLPEPDGIGYFQHVRPDVKYHVVSTGEHGASPLIMLHGFPEFWWSWRHQLRFFDKHQIRAIAPDLRGFNRSDKPLNGYDPVTLAGDIVGLMDVMGYEQAALLGNDFGGFLAYVIAFLYPERVSRLAVINTLYPARWVRRKNTGAFGVSLFHTLASLGHDAGAPLLRFGNQVIGIGRIMLWLAYQRQMFPFAVRRAYSKAYNRSWKTATAYAPLAARWMTAQAPESLVPAPPLLVIWSTHDWTAPLRITTGLTNHMPESKLAIINHAGHWVQQEQPELVNQVVLEFLKS